LIALPADPSSYISHFSLSEILVFDGAFFTTIGRNRLVSLRTVFTDGSYDRTEREYRKDGLLPRCDGPLL
jgi:hypothetical protein